MEIVTPSEPSATVSAISISNASCRIGGRVILDSISIELPSGQITGILGPNGAGKSTLLGLILGLKSPSSGTVTLFEHGERAGSTSLKRRIGAVLQEVALYDELSAEENLRFAASLYGIKNRDERIAEVLNITGLTERSKDATGTLSGGMRRRLTIGRALLHKPDLLVIDEPTLGVDVEARHAIWAHLRHLRSQGTTVIVSTNYLDEALALCDSVAVLREGRLLVVEPPHELVARAGSCLEIEYDPRDETNIIGALYGLDGVIRTEHTLTGLTIFLSGSAAPDAIVRSLLNVAALKAFRVRAADLAEVFKAIE